MFLLVYHMQTYTTCFTNVTRKTLNRNQMTDAAQIDPIRGYHKMARKHRQNIITDEKGDTELKQNPALEKHEQITYNTATK